MIDSTRCFARFNFFCSCKYIEFNKLSPVVCLGRVDSVDMGYLFSSL